MLCFWQVEPAQYSTFDVFIGYGYRPTLHLFDGKKTIPNVSCTEIAYNSTDGCDDSAYQLNLSDDISKSGTYFIGILYEESTGNDRRRRKRSAMPSYDPATDVNYTMSIVQEQCQSWNRTNEIWTSHGCRVRYFSDKQLYSFYFLISFAGDKKRKK